MFSRGADLILSTRARDIAIRSRGSPKVPARLAAPQRFELPQAQLRSARHCAALILFHVHIHIHSVSIDCAQCCLILLSLSPHSELNRLLHNRPSPIPPATPTPPPLLQTMSTGAPPLNADIAPVNGHTHAHGHSRGRGHTRSRYAQPSPLSLDLSNAHQPPPDMTDSVNNIGSYGHASQPSWSQHNHSASLSHGHSHSNSHSLAHHGHTHSVSSIRHDAPHVHDVNPRATAVKSESTSNQVCVDIQRSRFEVTTDTPQA